MTEIEKELERFIASGKATTKVNSGRFHTTHIDPLKIAKHFAIWQEQKDILSWDSQTATFDPNIKTSEDERKAAISYAYDLDACKEGSGVNINDVVMGFYGGLKWQKEQMKKGTIEGEVVDKGDFIKFADGKYIDLNPTMGAEPFVKLEEGDKVKVIIIKE